MTHCTFPPPTVASLVGGLRATERVGKKERERVRERKRERMTAWTLSECMHSKCPRNKEEESSLFKNNDNGGGKFKSAKKKTTHTHTQ